MPRVRERISLRGLLAALAIAGLAVVLVAAAVIAVSVERVSGGTGRVTTVYEPAATDVYNLSLATSDMERGVSLYAIGGVESDLRPYVDGERRSAIALASLGRLLGGDPDISPLLEAVQSSRSEWLSGVAQPSIKAVRDGRQGRAERIIAGDESLLLFDRFVTDSDRLRNTIDEERSEAFDQLRQLTGSLFYLVGAGVLILLFSVLSATYLMRRWVLAPLRELRDQMQSVAQDVRRGGTISPSGPREISDVGRDAEEMRRQLVDEIDRAERATAAQQRATDAARRAAESMASDAPVVAAIMRELAAQTDPAPEGIEVYGEILPAETVLAGDFWDCIAVPDGRAALVIADVAGHGDRVGVAASRIKHLLAVATASGRSPGSALALADRRLADENEPIATAAIVVVDPATGTLTWSNAGHPPPVVVRSSGKTEELVRTGPLLSWLGGPWEARTTTLAAGDCLLLFSDGLVESHDAGGEQLGVPGLLTLFDRAASTGGEGHRGVKHLVRRTLALARERCVDWERDDVTLVALTLVPTTAGVVPDAVS